MQMRSFQSRTPGPHAAWKYTHTHTQTHDSHREKVSPETSLVETEEGVRGERPERAGVQYEEGQSLCEIPEISEILRVYTRCSPPRYIHTESGQYQLPADYEFFSSRIRTRQRQSGSARVSNMHPPKSREVLNHGKNLKVPVYTEFCTVEKILVEFW